MIKKMNKKGQFFSLLVVIIVILLAVFFYYTSDAATREDNLYIKRVTISNVNNFVSEFEKTSIPLILETAAKPAIAERISKPAVFTRFTKTELVDIMKDGNEGGITYLADYLTTDSAKNQILGALTFTLKDGGIFDYTLDEVRQPDFKTIELEFIVNYKFESFENTWENTNKHVILKIPVYGLEHPSYNRELITKEHWKKDVSGTCFIKQIFSDINGVCSNKNIMPKPIVP